MDSSDEKQLILDQYRIYSEAKEKFIDRQFSTNKFFLVLNIIVLLTTYILSTLTPQLQPIIVLSIVGFLVTLMWWINIDTYQVSIKVKYAKVLEHIETLLPIDPYHREYIEYQKMVKNKKLIVFGDSQKILSVIIGCVYFTVFLYSITNMIKFQLM